MAYTVLLHPRAHQDFKDLERTMQDRVKKRMERLKTEPDLGKPIHPSRFRSLRLGDYRIIYETLMDKNQVYVLRIGHRKNIYDDFSKLV